jgi:pyruvate ferredoxin oxidoreductase beta subunit
MTGGVETAWRVLKKRGKIDDTYKFICFGGDGGTYDIGLQSLSGAMERGHDMVYVCYDNEAYMNTGIQRSSATPRFADATTSPVGLQSYGKTQTKKDLTGIIAAHGVPYVAQTTMFGDFRDIHEKSHRAIYTEGPCFLNVLAPCPRGWRYEMEDLAEVCKLAVDTCVWPLYEVIDGKYVLNYMPKNKLPVEEYLRLQGRFAHMFKPGNEWMIEQVQQEVDKSWEELLALCNM